MFEHLHKWMATAFSSNGVITTKWGKYIGGKMQKAVYVYLKMRNKLKRKSDQ